jgi:hypothetical protein
VLLSPTCVEQQSLLCLAVDASVPQVSQPLTTHTLATIHEVAAVLCFKLCCVLLLPCCTAILYCPAVLRQLPCLLDLCVDGNPCTAASNNPQLASRAAAAPACTSDGRAWHREAVLQAACTPALLMLDGKAVSSALLGCEWMRTGSTWLVCYIHALGFSQGLVQPLWNLEGDQFPMPGQACVQEHLYETECHCWLSVGACFSLKGTAS